MEGGVEFTKCDVSSITSDVRFPLFERRSDQRERVSPVIGQDWVRKSSEGFFTAYLTPAPLHSVKILLSNDVKR